MPRPASLDTLQNEWIYGPTGVGKSRSVRDTHPVHYPKARNKWWDGYKGEEVVVIDEVSPTDAEWIAPMLKVWADHFPQHHVFYCFVKCFIHNSQPTID